VSNTRLVSKQSPPPRTVYKHPMDTHDGCPPRPYHMTMCLHLGWGESSNRQLARVSNRECTTPSFQARTGSVRRLSTSDFSNLIAQLCSCNTCTQCLYTMEYTNQSVPRRHSLCINEPLHDSARGTGSIGRRSTRTFAIPSAQRYSYNACTQYSYMIECAKPVARRHSLCIDKPTGT
jgi:hypothetical protein